MAANKATLDARTLRAVAKKMRKLSEIDLVLIQSAQLRSDYGEQARYGWRHSWNLLWANSLEQEAKGIESRAKRKGRK